jgi:hypothetical protein
MALKPDAKRQSYVVVTVEGGLVQSTDVYQGGLPGVIEPVVIDWDVEGMDNDELDELLERYKHEAAGLPRGWFVRDNIESTIQQIREKCF